MFYYELCTGKVKSNDLPHSGKYTKVNAGMKKLLPLIITSELNLTNWTVHSTRNNILP